ncbi:uncharacterized protein LOC141719131 [Apium graveolens]|uniref:uncharacterized protein LOC141719131 n=1 Tax=Apium graveolens TaxID=4045 RepID=UPI003D7B3105
MASTQLHRLILLIATLLLSIAASNAARPCKTILLISTTTSFPLIENTNLQNPSHVTLFFINTQPINPNNFLSYKSNAFLTNRRSLNPPQLQDTSSSIRDSTLDIVSIVGALLFGVGSGALTAAIMYLVWSMFSPRRFEFGVDSDDEEMDNSDEDIYSPKKMGYVAVPVEGKQVN